MHFNQRLMVLIVFLLMIGTISVTQSYPQTQKIVVQGHEWTVPDEPGWHEVLNEAEPIRQDFFSNCASSRDCRLAVEKLRQIFLKHPISRKHFQTNPMNLDSDNDAQSIFKWG